MGLPTSLRLRRSADFDRVSRHGRRIGTKGLTVLYCPNDTMSPRFGLAVSRKVGNAVVRNRVKRWLREAVRNSRGSVTGLDVVFVARPLAARASASILANEVREALARIGGTR